MAMQVRALVLRVDEAFEQFDGAGEFLLLRERELCLDRAEQPILACRTGGFDPFTASWG